MNKSRRDQGVRQATRSWLNLRLQMLGVAMVTVVAFIAVLEHRFRTVNVGLVGLAISYALSITNLVNGVAVFFTETEKQMISVERAQEFIEDVPKEDIKPSVVLCIDEATASIDHATASLVQDTISEQFSQSTALSIAHRVQSVLGSVAELDTPSNLLVDPTSSFYALIHGRNEVTNEREICLDQDLP